MDHHGFLIKSAIGKGRPAIWKLLKDLGQESPKTIGRESGRYALKFPSQLKPGPTLSASKAEPKVTGLKKEAVRGFLRSKLRVMPQTPELAAALPNATEAVSTARKYMQSMMSANLDPKFMGQMTSAQRDKYLQMVLNRGKPQQSMQKVRALLPTLPKDLKGLLM